MTPANSITAAAPALPAFMPVAAGGIQLSASGAVQLRNLAEAAGFAQLLQAGGMLPKGMTPAGAVVAILAGANVGLGPFESVQNMAVVGGRPALFGDGLKAVVKASGLLESEKVEWIEKDGGRTGCRVTVKRKGETEPITGEFTVAQAKRAGLWGKAGPWTEYPARMLLARARAFAYRDAFPDALRGIRSAEEERDVAEGVTVEGVTVEDAAPAAPSPALPAAAPIPPKRRTRATAAELVRALPSPDAAPVAAVAPPPTAAGAPAPVTVAEGKPETLDFL